MAKAARERLARLLAGQEAGAFSAQLSVPSDALRLEVDGVGQVRLPVRPAQAKKLCGVARPAHFGHREETILDPAVRDTWEISPDLVSLGGPSWAPALEGALTELADQLGVPAGNRLEAELHALLVYGPGQFFVPHTDTEKNDAMIGTLTVTLSCRCFPIHSTYRLSYKYCRRGLPTGQFQRRGQPSGTCSYVRSAGN